MREGEVVFEGVEDLGERDLAVWFRVLFHVIEPREKLLGWEGTHHVTAGIRQLLAVEDEPPLPPIPPLRATLHNIPRNHRLIAAPCSPSSHSPRPTDPTPAHLLRRARQRHRYRRRDIRRRRRRAVDPPNARRCVVARFRRGHSHSSTMLRGRTGSEWNSSRISRSRPSRYRYRSRLLRVHPTCTPSSTASRCEVERSLRAGGREHLHRAPDRAHPVQHVFVRFGLEVECACVGDDAECVVVLFELDGRAGVDFGEVEQAVQFVFC